jgi:uncharacterized protein with NRDE domain
MCLILLAWQAHPVYPLVFAGNRDESYDRPSAVADVWKDDAGIFGGRDLDKGGTWLGLNLAGRFAAVTNYREGAGARKPAPRSRGELTASFLKNAASPEDYVASIAPDAHQYGGFSLLVGDFERLYYLSNRGPAATPVARGVHGLSNHLIDTPWPKVSLGKQRVSALLGAGEKQLIEGLFAALGDREAAPDGELPDSGVGIARERELSPAFIPGERYGTRASSVVLVDRDYRTTFIERSFGPRGVALGTEVRRNFTLQVTRATGRKTKAAGHDV